jgi:hypothetical protein
MNTCIDCSGALTKPARGPMPQRCAACRQERKRAQRAEVRAEPRTKTHGYSGYTHGCKCEVCTAAKREYVAQRRAAGLVVDLRRNHDPRARGYTGKTVNVTAGRRK